MKEIKSLKLGKRVYTLWAEVDSETQSEFTLEITSLSGAFVSSIGLFCEEQTIIDYDGVYGLSEKTIEALTVMGFDTTSIF